jgi:carbonic anhydrase
MKKILHAATGNKLFLVCPDCHMENYLQDYFGDHVYFVTASGIVMNTNDMDAMEGFCNLLHNERINEIHVVCETSCVQMQNIIRNQKPYGFYFEEVLIDLFVDNYFEIMNHSAEFDRLKTFAEKNIIRQIDEIFNCPQIMQACAELDIEIKGLLVSKKTNLIEEVLIPAEKKLLSEF